MNAISPPVPMDLRDALPPPVNPPAADLAGLIDRHQAPLWRYLRYLGAKPAEADDLTQETFLAVARCGFEDRGTEQTSGYLRTVARNQLLSLRRRLRRETPLTSFDEAEAVWADREPDRWDERLDAIRDCVDSLEGRAKQAVDLHYREKAGREAIADSLGIGAEGVKSLLRRTRAVLRDCVERTLRTA